MLTRSLSSVPDVPASSERFSIWLISRTTSVPHRPAMAMMIRTQGARSDIRRRAPIQMGASRALADGDEVQGQKALGRHIEASGPHHLRIHTARVDTLLGPVRVIHDGLAVALSMGGPSELERNDISVSREDACLQSAVFHISRLKRERLAAHIVHKVKAR